MRFFVFLLSLVILLSIFFRFWQLSGVSFEADQETVAFMAKQLLVDHKPTLLGVITSSGNIFLGPLYYYLYAIPMIFTAMNPVGQAFLSSLIGVASTMMFYFVGKKMFSKEVGLLAAFFHATSIIIITLERPIWNVTGALFIFIAVIYCFYEIGLGNKKYWTYLLMMIGLGLHFHLTTIFFIPTAILFYVYMLLQTKKINSDDFKYLFLGLISFGLLLSPLVLFDLRHNFMNSKNLITFLFAGGGVSQGYLTKIIHILTDEITVLTSFLHLSIPVASVAFLTTFFIFLKTQKSFLVANIFLFLTASFGLAFFKGQITSYYYLLLFPIVILGFCELLVQVIRYKKIFSVFVLGYLGFFLLTNTQEFFAKKTSFSLFTKEKVVNYISTRAGNKPYYVSYSIDHGRNFGFSYLFWLSGHKPSSTLINPVYTIVIPYDYGGIKPDFKIDDIGLVLPKES